MQFIKLGGLIYMKVLRRAIILICLLFLIRAAVFAWPEGKYYDVNLKNKVKNNKATVIELNKKGNFDGNTFAAQRIINTSDETYLRYRLISDGRGWSFSSSIKLFDENNKEYISLTGGHHGKIWGTEGLATFEKLPENTKEITLVVESFDRKLELKIPLNKAGGKNE